MTEFFNKILEEYKEKRIVVISHGGSIKFLLLNWCEVTQNAELVYKDKILDITSPCLIKLIFKGNQLLSIEELEY